jgi:hypothetical protein
MAHIGEAHEIAIGFLDDEIVELLRRAEVGLGEHSELALLALDAARRHLDVLPPQRRLDVLQRELKGGEPLGIEPDAHGILPVAEQAHLGNPWKGVELVFHIALGVVGDLERRMLVAEEREMEDRLRVSSTF